MIITIIVIVLMLVLSIFLLTGRGAFLISGYNTMCPEHKDQYNERALSRFVGILLLAVCFCMAFIVVGDYFAITWLTIVSIFLVVLLPLGAVVYMNNTMRFFMPNANPAVVMQIKRKNRFTTIIIIVVSVVVLVGMGVMFSLGERDPGVYVYQNHMEIQGMYGLSIGFDSITEVSLLSETMQEIGRGRRLNGYNGLGGTLKGHFTAGLLFVQEYTAPTIRIERYNHTNVYISFRDSQQTEMLFLELYNKINP